MMLIAFAWITAAVGLSYLISYVADLKQLVDIGIRLWPAVRRQWIAVLLSCICRTIAVILIYSLLVYFHGTFPILNAPPFAAGVQAPVLALLAGLCVSGIGICFSVLSQRMAGNRADTPLYQWSFLVRAVVRAEQLGWRTLVGDLESELSDQVAEQWREYSQDLGVVHTLYEERKIEVIDRTLRNPPSGNVELWVYYGLMTGNTNVKKIEALFWTIGLPTTILELKRAQSVTHRSTRHVSADQRDCPRDLYHEIWSPRTRRAPAAVIKKLTTSKRHGEKHLGHIISENPGILDRRNRAKGAGARSQRSGRGQDNGG